MAQGAARVLDQQQQGNAPAVMHHTIDWLLWRILHLLFKISVLISSAISRGTKILGRALFTGTGGLEDSTTGVKEKAASGLTIAAVFDNLEGKEWECRVSQLVWWFRNLNVRHLTLYDPAGVLKRSKLQLEKNLTGRFSRMENELTDCEFKFLTCGDRQAVTSDLAPIHEVSGLTHRQNGHSDVDSIEGLRIPASNGRGEMKVEILSLLDGKESLVKAARTVCENAYKLHYATHSQTKLGKLTEKDVNESLQLNGMEGPDPDLLLLVGKTRSLHGFPPWRLRLTEIVHLGDFSDLSAESLTGAMEDFAKKTHRYGR